MMQSRVDPQSVIWAYRLFLDREPENPEVVEEKVKAFASTEDVDSAVDLQTLFTHVQETWEYLGETEPHWSALTSNRFERSNILDNIEAFYDSGRQHVWQLFRTLDRNRIEPARLRSCLEYGCGPGRVSGWLAERFEKVFAYDISRSHLQEAESYLAGAGISNVTLHHIKQVQDISNLPKVDLVYSILVLQHSPPPMISFIVKEFLKALNPGGIALFQVPTYRLGYRFSLSEYLSSQAGRREVEMHVLPQAKIFDLVRQEGGKLIEVIEDGCTGLVPKELSNTFLIQKQC
jgi:SAM-dependent methyltransferase